MNFFLVEKGISKEDGTSTSPSISMVKEARTKGRADETKKAVAAVALIILRMGPGQEQKPD